MPFHSDRAWVVTAPPARLWEALSDTGSYSRWWPWLRGFDGQPLAEGSRATCTIRPPLPYAMRVTVEAVRVVAPALVVARVSGDLEGEARLEVQAHPAGSMLRLTWDLEVHRPLLAMLERVARPMLEFGQSWVVDRGMSQFGAAVGLGVGDASENVQ